MILFLGGLSLLVVGYFTYGRLVERIVGPDDRRTPAVRNPDGVDYVELPTGRSSPSIRSSGGRRVRSPRC